MNSVLRIPTSPTIFLLVSQRTTGFGRLGIGRQFSKYAINTPRNQEGVLSSCSRALSPPDYKFQGYLERGFGSVGGLHHRTSWGFRFVSPPQGQCNHSRCVHTSSTDEKPEKTKDKDEAETDNKPPSSKVEETINTLKQQEKEKGLIPEPKRSIWKRIEDEVLHYYHGFRLLFIDTRICMGLIWRLIRGYSLSRREHRQLIRTSSDLFRLVPFSLFIIIPFMELLLPVFLKFFPGMLPSTFQSKNDREVKMRKQLKVKLEMAKFLQETLDEMALKAKGHSSEDAKKFAQFFQNIRSSGQEVSNEEIIKFCKLFEDEITLDSLNRQQLVALCRVLEINYIGNTAILRLILRHKVKSLIADDKVIEDEGIDKLNIQELQMACKSRGMRALGVPEDRLRRQLAQWINLSLHQKIPPSLLLLSRAMYLPEDLPESSRLQATLSSLSDAAALQVKADIGEREGRIDHKTRIQVVIEEQKLIAEERKEAVKAKVIPKEEKEIKEEKKEEAAETAEPKPEKARLPEEPVKETKLPESIPSPLVSEMYLETVSDVIERGLSRHVPHPLADDFKDPVTKDDIDTIETALEHLTEGKYGSELKELRSEVTEYEEDVENLSKLKQSVDVKETKAAKLLHAKVDKMISKVSQMVHQLGELGQEQRPETEEAKGQLVKLEDLMNEILKFQSVSDPAQRERILDVLESLDFDQDGQVEMEHLVKVIELIGKENVNLSPKQLQDIIDVIKKEELQKDKEELEKKIKSGDSGTGPINAGESPKQK